jgi:6-phosphogluconolactonase (cycloisomerase 2 family)
MHRKSLWAGVCLLTALTGLSLLAGDKGGKDKNDDDERDDARSVYTLTNDASANSVMVYRLGHGGALQPVGPVATGGKGNGAGLGSQGALILSRGGRWLIGVNAGSDDVSVFRVSDSGITLASRTASGGHMPISVTLSGNVLYVLNAGMPNNITGFTLTHDGSLSPIANSTKMLSGPDAGPAQVQFSPDGDQLVVTEKGTNLIDVFPVDRNGVAGMRVSSPSTGMTPFGFDFGKRGLLFVSEAFGGAANASAASSYDVRNNGMLQVITPSEGTQQTAACWLVVSPNGRYAYTTNTGSRTVSLFKISRKGELTLDESVAGSTPAGGAIDAGFSKGGRYLHVLTAGAASIVTFRVESDGSLAATNTVMAPPSAVGLAAE